MENSTCRCYKLWLECGILLEGRRLRKRSLPWAEITRERKHQDKSCTIRSCRLSQGVFGHYTFCCVKREKSVHAFEAMASYNSNEAAELQQVMGAQDAGTAAPQVNGVDHGPSREGRLQDAGRVLPVAHPAGTLAGHEGASAGTMYGATDQAPQDRPTTSTSVPLREDTESLRRREADQVLPTTVNVDESLRRGIAEVGGDAAISQSGFMTPRSSPPGPMMQNNWLSGLEVPRWVSRLGNYLSIAQEQLAPSPLAGTSNPSAPTPPGGVAFALRSPPRMQRQLRAPTPPSSEVSAGAIQAEVQRQLGGILNRLRAAEDTNMHLRHELEAERERLRALRQHEGRRNAPPTITTPFGATGITEEHPGGILGGLRTSGEPSGDLPTLPLPSQLLEPGAPGLRLPDGLSATPGDHLRPSECDREQGVQGGCSGVREGQNEYHGSLPTAPGPPPLPERRGFLRSLLPRPRSQTPPPPRTPPAAESPTVEALARGMQQLQELQLQALQRGHEPGNEVIKPGTTTLTALPTLVGGAESALQFQDWIEVTTAVMYDISEQSGVWWKEVQALVDKAYQSWLAATPLERLAISPAGAEEVCSQRWTRLNARVAAMLLAAMNEDQRADMISHRLSTNSVRMLFRLYVLYQPGGSLERQDVLKRLQSPSDYLERDSLEDALKAVRAWPRWMARCQTVKMAYPDPSVLARGLRQLTQKWIETSPDAAFRTAMLRTSLRLGGQPDVDSVKSYQRHLQAELESMVVSQHSVSTATTSSPPRVRVLDKVNVSSKEGDRDKGREKEKDKGASTADLCRYFMRPGGCKRGGRCTFSHTMSHLDKETRNKKCLACGSEAHRAKDCPVARPANKGHTSTTSSPTKDQRGGKGQNMQPGMASMSTTATSGSTDDTASTASTTVQGTAWTLESLMQAAQQVVQSQSSSTREDTSPEKTQATIKMIKIKDVRVCTANATSSALLDSGATHCLRNAHTQEEWDTSDIVMVQLAGDNRLTMRMSAAGSLLMPPRLKPSDEGSDGRQGQTIVPLGELIRTLGYTLVWSPLRCYIEDSEGKRTPLETADGCPQLNELAALSLISRLEERKRERLLNEVDATMDRVTMAALAMDRSWMDYLREYVVDEKLEAGLRAVRDASFLGEVPGECLHGLVQQGVHANGWTLLKNIDYLTRPQKRYIYQAKKWVVHLFAGDPGDYRIFQLDRGSTVVIELDITRCKGHDIMKDETWRLLQWGAINGKIDAILGGPPSRGGLRSLSGSSKAKDLKSLAAIVRMLWLYAVADAGRKSTRTGALRDRPVAFVIEHPTEALGTEVSLWRSTMWKEFQVEMEMSAVTFDQRAMGSPISTSTTLGTNVYYLQGLNGLSPEDAEGQPPDGHHDASTWSPGLVSALVTALMFWERRPRCIPIMAALSPEQWRQHVQSGHANYQRNCLTCVMGRGTGKRHARVRHPDMFALTVDLAGPVKPGLDVTSKGALGKGLKYMIVARYVLPVEFVKAYSGRSPPEDGGIEENQGATRNPEQPMGQCDKELTKPSLLPPREEGEDDQIDRENPMGQCDEELTKPSLLPPREEGDPFSFCEDEPGEQCPLFDEDEPGEQCSTVHHEEPQDDRSCGFTGGTRTQRRQYKDYEDSLYEPSEAEEIDDKEGGGGREDPVPFPDCEAPKGDIPVVRTGLTE